MPIRVSVVIPAYNVAFCLQDCLTGVQRQTLPREQFEVILVDDGSSDNTLSLATQLKGSLGLDNLQIAHQANAGPASARNQGIRLAKGAIIAFLDSDCVPQPDWLENLIQPLLDNQELIGAEGRTLPASEQRTLVDHYIDNPNGGYYWTCNIAYRRQTLLDIGGFDEGFPYPASEDIDIAHRIQKKGAIAFAPDAVVYHLILTRGFSKHLSTASTFSSIIRLHRKHPDLLSLGESFMDISLFQFKQLLLPIVTRRREFPKNPFIYLEFCLLQLLMALDTLIRLPAYYQESIRPLKIREPFHAPPEAREPVA